MSDLGLGFPPDAAPGPPNASADPVAVRLFARWTDDPTECPFAFDLILDRASGEVSGGWPIFGATDYDRPTPRAFVLDAAGRLHFGGADRQWRTDLRSLAMGVGKRFRVWWTEDDVAFYQIVKIAALGDKAARLRFGST